MTPETTIPGTSFASGATVPKERAQPACAVSKRDRPLRTVALYGVAHAAVDAACALLVVSLLHIHPFRSGTFLWLAIAYNILAFAGQAPLGLLVDRIGYARETALLGIISTVAGLLLRVPNPFIAVVLAGIGNAMFHVGGGVISLRADRDHSFLPGLFVAPGALGLAVGAFVGRMGHVSAVPFVVALVIWIPLLREAGKSAPGHVGEHSKGETALVSSMLLLFSIAVRSLAGFSVVAHHKSSPVTLWFLVFAAVLGKGVGGLLADRIGPARVGAGALFLSAPLLAASGVHPVNALLGMLLLQTTMPVTLRALTHSLVGNSGTAFGLACTALVIGAIPAAFGMQWVISTGPMIVVLTLSSAVAMVWGLNWLRLSAKQSADRGEIMEGSYGLRATV